MDDDEKRPNIIIDNGGGYIKAGFSGEEGPSAVFQTMVGYPKNHVENSGDKKDYYVGKIMTKMINAVIKHGMSTKKMEFVQSNPKF